MVKRSCPIFLPGERVLTRNAGQCGGEAYCGVSEEVSEVAGEVAGEEVGVVGSEEIGCAAC